MRNLNRDFVEVAEKLHNVASAFGTFTEEPSTITTESVSNLNEFIESQNLNGVGLTYYGHVTRMVLKCLATDDNGDVIQFNMSYDNLKKYRNDAILWMQFRYELSNALNEMGIETYSDGDYIRINFANSADLQKTLEYMMQSMTFHASYLEPAVSSWNRTFRDYTNHYERENRVAKVNGQGLSKKIQERTDQELTAKQWMDIEEEIQKYQTKIGNHIVARTWGWEIEAPNPGSNVRVPAGVEAGSDGSVESYETDTDGCECECRDCTYHECSCDNCNNYNDDPQHCNDSDCSNVVSYEFRTTGGITRALHPGLRTLLDQIKNTEKNETAGTHIHVFAKDLTAKQIGIVLAGYAITQRIWDVICGRNIHDDERCQTYANHIPVESISATLRTDTLYHVGKFTAINTHHSANERGTLEFRQMNCNFNFDRITFFAWMARGLIQSVKNGAQITDFFAIKTITDFIAIYEKYGFTFREETQEVEDPYGSRYRNVVRTFQVA